MKNTKISWCDHTFNPWIGCTKVSPACDNCYAENMASRFKMVQWGNAPRLRTSDEYWKQPLRWNKQAKSRHDAWLRFKESYPDVTDQQLIEKGFIRPIRPKVFCGSMCDVFDNNVPIMWRMDLFSLISRTPYLDWLLLTKRIGNVEKMRQRDSVMFDMLCDGPCWVGITICNQEEADRDIPKLINTPAAKRFLSIEPMLGSIDIKKWLVPQCDNGSIPSADGAYGVMCPYCQGVGPSCLGVDWVIAGGESGHHARPVHPLWLESLRDQCHSANTPFFFKQWGEWAPRYKLWFTLNGKDLQTIDPQCKTWPRVIRLTESGKNGRIVENFDGGEDVFMQRIGTKKTGRMLSGYEYLNFPKE